MGKALFPFHPNQFSTTFWHIDCRINNRNSPSRGYDTLKLPNPKKANHPKGWGAKLLA
jgi:hypothetical protein